MTTVQLTGGSCEYSIPTNYNEGKHGAKVVLNFSVAEGAPNDASEAFLHYVGDLARTAALGMASGVQPPKNTAVVVAPPMPAPIAPPPAPVAATPLPAQAVPVVPPTPTPAPVASPGVSAPPLPDTLPAPIPSAPTEIPWDDRTITEHLTKAAARLAPAHGEAAPEKMRQLIRQFLPEGSLPKAGLIAVEHRALFLQHLEALQ